MACKYVKDFSFPAEAGFTGSAGQKPVQGYMRGGKVEKPAPVEKSLGGIVKALSPLAAIASGDEPFGGALGKGGVMGGLAGLALQNALKKKKPLALQQTEVVAPSPQMKRGGGVKVASREPMFGKKY